MNYAAAFAQALNEALDASGAKKTGPNRVARPDPEKVGKVRFESEQAGGYSEYTQWDAHARLIFTDDGTTPDEMWGGFKHDYYCEVDLLEVPDLEVGPVIERAVQIMTRETS